MRFSIDSPWLSGLLAAEAMSIVCTAEVRGMRWEREERRDETSCFGWMRWVCGVGLSGLPMGAAKPQAAGARRFVDWGGV